MSRRENKNNREYERERGTESTREGQRVRERGREGQRVREREVQRGREEEGAEWNREKMYEWASAAPRQREGEILACVHQAPRWHHILLLTPSFSANLFKWLIVILLMSEIEFLQRCYFHNRFIHKKSKAAWFLNPYFGGCFSMQLLLSSMLDG